MNVKDQKFIYKWSKQQKKGKTTYMLIHGLIWGITAAIISTLFRLSNGPLSDLVLSYTFLIRLIVMITVGMFFQNWQWNFNNKRYDRLLSEQPDSTTDSNHTSAS